MLPGKPACARLAAVVDSRREVRIGLLQILIDLRLDLNLAILDVDLDNFLCARALHPRDASYFLELAERAELITVSLERDWVRCLRFRGETISAESLFEDLLQLGK